MRWFCFFFLSTLFYCSDPSAYRTYKIKDSDSRRSQIADPSHNTDTSKQGNSAVPIKIARKLPGNLSWQAPQGWREKPASGMRLATLISPEGLEASLISFPGNVGGLEANLSRWAGQIDLSPSALRHIERTAKKGVYPYLFVDYSHQVDADKETIMAGVFAFQDKTLFVKLKGRKSAMLKRKSDFFSFLDSLQ